MWWNCGESCVLVRFKYFLYLRYIWIWINSLFRSPSLINVILAALLDDKYMNKTIKCSNTRKESNEISIPVIENKLLNRTYCESEGDHWSLKKCEILPMLINKVRPTMAKKLFRLAESGELLNLVVREEKPFLIRKLVKRSHMKVWTFIWPSILMIWAAMTTDVKINT